MGDRAHAQQLPRGNLLRHVRPAGRKALHLFHHQNDGLGAFLHRIPVLAQESFDRTAQFGPHVIAHGPVGFRIPPKGANQVAGNLGEEGAGYGPATYDLELCDEGWRPLLPAPAAQSSDVAWELVREAGTAPASVVAPNGRASVPTDWSAAAEVTVSAPADDAPVLVCAGRPAGCGVTAARVETPGAVPLR